MFYVRKKVVSWFKTNKKRIKKTILIGLLLFLVYFVFFSNDEKDNIEEVPFTSFTEMIGDNKVKSVVINFNEDFFIFETKSEESFVTENPRSEGFKRELLESGIEVEEKLNSDAQTLSIFLNNLYRFTMLFLIFFFVKRMMAGMKGSKKMNVIEKGIPGVNFSTVAGNEEVKEEMKVLVDFLKESKRFTDSGATLPKGTVFYGPSGTGKTLMAKAVAGEAGVPFISINGSDFIELYVGTGAKRVRELFKEARKLSPCIIFIDEIDAVGGKRTGDSNTEYKQTVNALLSEMDGFEKNDNIVVIAATNRLSDLDSALIRPGRFDKQVAINLPDKDDRFKILNVHAKGKKFDDSVNFEDWAATTIGFSGADIQALMNEAAILSVVANRKKITSEDLDNAHYKMIMKGHKKKNQKGRNKDELKVVAWHEAGHALVAKKLANNTVPKVSILSSTSGAGGVTFITPDDNVLPSKKDLKNRIKMLYAGRIAESLLFKNDEDITAGASQDIKQATNLIRLMITEYGMSDELGMINPHVLLNGSQQASHIVKEAQHLSISLYKEAYDFVKNNMTYLEKIAEALLEKETISELELESILNQTDSIDSED